jgi:hypothetical protein
MRTDLQSVLDQVRTMDAAELPFLLGDLEVIRAIALSRLMAPAVEVRPDELLDVAETSRRMGVGKDYLYRNSRRWPFTRRIGRKLLFSSAGLDQYLKRAR